MLKEPERKTVRHTAWMETALEDTEKGLHVSGQEAHNVN